MTRITLKNDFHNTSVTLYPRTPPTGGMTLSARQVARSRRTLCGISGCTCGGHAGERGPQWAPSGKGLYLEPYGEGRLLVHVE